MNFNGILIGIVTFLVIGLFHPLVIKTEYYFGARVWPAYLVAGIIAIALSFLVQNTLLSAVLGVTGFSSLWSIHELIEQEQRVEKGWFPANPDKKK